MIVIPREVVKNVHLELINRILFYYINDRFVRISNEVKNKPVYNFFAFFLDGRDAVIIWPRLK